MRVVVGRRIVKNGVHLAKLSHRGLYGGRDLIFYSEITLQCQGLTAGSANCLSYWLYGLLTARGEGYTGALSCGDQRRRLTHLWPHTSHEENFSLQEPVAATAFHSFCPVLGVFIGRIEVEP